MDNDSIKTVEDELVIDENGLIELLPHCERTFCEMAEQISLYGRSVAVLPTGTGKTGIIINFLRTFQPVWKIIVAASNDNIDEIKSHPGFVGDNVIATTYANLGKIMNSYAMTLPIRLIILDEVHRASAKEWSKGVKGLIELHKNAVVAGFTATPIRYLDKKKDVVAEWFNGISAGNMTLQEAMQEGILPRPIQVEAMFDITKDVEKQKKKLITIVDKGNSMSTIAGEHLRKLDEYSENWNEQERDKSIISLMSKYIGGFTDKNYKHIVFMPNIESANTLKETVMAWFKSIYPNNHVNVYTVHSKSKDKATQLSEFKTVKSINDIDVLIAVNMANESMHVKNTKSVMMLRYTKSPNLFIQQMGRALSIGGEQPIIFDFIGNIDALSDTVDFIMGIESKVSNLYKDDIGKLLHANADKIFHEYDDQTVEFREMISSMNLRNSSSSRVTWSDKMQKIREAKQNGLESIEAIEDKTLRNWIAKARREFILGTLERDKAEELKSVLGIEVYMTEQMLEYGKQWITVAENMRNAKNMTRNEIEQLGFPENKIASEIEQLRFRIYTGKVPDELIAYMREEKIDPKVSNEWAIEKLREYDTALTNRFLYIVDTITSSNKVSLDSDEFELSTYLDICQAVVRLKNYFDRYDGGEDCIEAVMFNMMHQYWKLNISKIASKIEIDIVALALHIMYIRYMTANCEEYEANTVKNMILNIPEEMRSKSINKLIKKLDHIKKNEMAELIAF